MEGLSVYSFRRCPFAIRVRMTLHEKGLQFKTIDEDLKNFSPELLRMHPEAKVPVLVHGDKVIYESAIITEYLDDQFPQVSLMPTSAAERCDVRLWTYWCNHTFKVHVDQYKYGTNRFSESECVGCEERLTNNLKKLETRLSQVKWLVGENLSLADIHTFPFVRQLWRVTESLKGIEDFPATKAWLDKLLQRPSFLKAMEKPK